MHERDGHSNNQTPEGLLAEIKRTKPFFSDRKPFTPVIYTNPWPKLMNKYADAVVYEVYDQNMNLL